jgi:hypothetical protein
MDFAHHLVFLKEQNVSENGSVSVLRLKGWDCLLSWGWDQLFLTNPSEQVQPTFSPKDENRSSFQNVVFFEDYQTMHRVRKYSNTIVIYWVERKVFCVFEEMALA